MWVKRITARGPIVLLLIAVFIVTGCAREVYNISWKGVVADRTTGQPVARARIFASSIYQKNIDETDEISKYTLSDEAGHFNVSFPRGFGLTVRTSASGYLSGIDYKVVRKPGLTDTIFISRQPFDASLVVRKMDAASFLPSIPFIRESIIYKEDNRKTEQETLNWGFDFIAGENTLNLDSADVWIEVNNNTGRIVLNAAPGGGIFPVNNYSSAEFFTNLTEAPETGYVKNYTLTGKESGFFVLCRNGVNVAKMIPEDRVCVLLYKTENGSSIKETGIRFNYLFQPDLKNRLCFPVSASVSGVKGQDKYLSGFDANHQLSD
jgi:hypothetical protein